jgi:antitoxin ParD1/3/4
MLIEEILILTDGIKLIHLKICSFQNHNLFNTVFFDKIKIFVNRKIMNIQIQPELEQIIEAQIATGRYANPEEVISKALNLLLQWEKGYQLWVAQTREKVDVAIEQLDRGEGIEGEVVIEQLRDKLRKAREIQG